MTFPLSMGTTCEQHYCYVAQHFLAWTHTYTVWPFGNLFSVQPEPLAESSASIEFCMYAVNKVFHFGSYAVNNVFGFLGTLVGML
jgi:hypothetical protein